MGKRHTPEDFIREFLHRGFNRDQILSRANKKDRSFYQMVFDILQHTTLIEKIENQVEDSNQAIINFDNPSYSSKTLLKDINRIKEEKKRKTNGRSDLAVHTDIEIDDLLAPIPGFNNKVAFTSVKRTPKKKLGKTTETQLSIFDEAESDHLPIVVREPIKEELIKTSPDETSILPVTSEVEPQPLNITAITSDKESSYYDSLPHKKLVSIIHKLNLRLKENNQTIRTKEDKITRSFTAADNLRKRLNQKIDTLKTRSRRYQLSFYTAVILFISTGITVKWLDMQKTGNSISINEPGLYATQETIKTNETSIQTAQNENNANDIEDENDFWPEDNNELYQPEAAIAANDETENNEDAPPNLEGITETPPKPEQVIHIVKRGENWWKISKKYLGKAKAHQYKKILKYNNLKRETLIIGQKIKIPTLSELEEE